MLSPTRAKLAEGWGRLLQADVVQERTEEIQEAIGRIKTLLLLSLLLSKPEGISMDLQSVSHAMKDDC